MLFLLKTEDGDREDFSWMVSIAVNYSEDHVEGWD